MRCIPWREDLFSRRWPIFLLFWYLEGDYFSPLSVTDDRSQIKKACRLWRATNTFNLPHHYTNLITVFCSFFHHSCHVALSVTMTTWDGESMEGNCRKSKMRRGMECSSFLRWSLRCSRVWCSQVRCCGWLLWNWMLWNLGVGYFILARNSLFLYFFAVTLHVPASHRGLLFQEMMPDQLQELNRGWERDSKGCNAYMYLGSSKLYLSRFQWVCTYSRKIIGNKRAGIWELILLCKFFASQGFVNFSCTSIYTAKPGEFWPAFKRRKKNSRGGILF